jgi:hypothetical protein
MLHLNLQPVNVTSKVGPPFLVLVSQSKSPTILEALVMLQS